MNPAVGKSGPGRMGINSSTVISGWLMTLMVASITSRRLWGGTLVAIPTAIPEEPLISRLGTLAGRMEGSTMEPS